VEQQCDPFQTQNIFMRRAATLMHMFALASSILQRTTRGGALNTSWVINQKIPSKLKQVLIFIRCLDYFMCSIR
jgi:hypothetical protein